VTPQRSQWRRREQRRPWLGDSRAEGQRERRPRGVRFDERGSRPQHPGDLVDANGFTAWHVQRPRIRAAPPRRGPSPKARVVITTSPVEEA